MDDCRCHLFVARGSAFAHAGADCGWPTLDGPCPDCGLGDEECTFFSENEGVCSGFTRLVMLCLRCQAAGLKRRYDAQVKAQVEALCARPSFAAGHFVTFKDGIRCVGGVWVPAQLDNGSSPFAFDRSVMPWRFVLRLGGDQVTMAALSALLAGPARADPPGSPPSPRDPEARIAELEAQLAALRVRLDAPPQPSVEEARRLTEAGLAARAPVSAAAGGFGGANATPSQAFSFAGGGATVVNSFNVAPDAGSPIALAQALRSAGYSAEEVLGALRGVSVQHHAPMRHPLEWSQLAQGTSPLERYTGLVGSLRQTATPRTLRVEVFDYATGDKKSVKHTVWPPARVDDVAPIHWDELAALWTQGLAEFNQKLKYVTPKADQALTPVLPTDTLAFLDHLRGCVDTYPVSSVVRAWEAAHHHFIDCYVSGRSAPKWDVAWLLPQVQVALVPPTARQHPAAGSALTDFCRNWNFREGRRCNPDPAADCQKVHACIRCRGSHPIQSCTQLE